MKIIGLQSHSDLILTGLSQWLSRDYQSRILKEGDDAADVDLLIYEHQRWQSVDKPKIRLLAKIEEYPFAYSAITWTITREELLKAVEQTLNDKTYIQPLLVEQIENFLHEEEVFAQLNRREQIYVQGILKGESNRELAHHLYISEKTVKNNLTQLYRKLKVSGRKEIEKKYKK